MMEYILSWAAIVGAIMGLVVFAGEGVKEKSKKGVSDWLLGVKRKKRWQELNWPATFIVLFDRIYTKKRWSWSFIWRSIVTSAGSVLMAWLLVNALTPNDFDASVIRIPLILIPQQFEDVSGAGRTGVLMLAGVFLYNLIPDYVSLLESRLVLSWMKNVRSSASIMILLVIDAVLTFCVFTVVTGAMLLIIGWPVVRLGNFSVDAAEPTMGRAEVYFEKNPDDLPANPDTMVVYDGKISLRLYGTRTVINPGDTVYVHNTAGVKMANIRFSPEGGYFSGITWPVRTFWESLKFRGYYTVFVYSTFFTSIWVWLYASSLFLLRLLARLKPVREFSTRHWDVEGKPFRYIGLMAILIVTLLFIVAAPFVL